MNFYRFLCIGLLLIIYLNMCIAGRCDNDTEFRCNSDNKCIDLTLRCNRVFDCTDHSDEENCGIYELI